MKEEKRAFEAAIKSLETDIEEYSIAAEKENNLTFLTKANSFWVTVLQKKETSSLDNLKHVFMMKLWIILWPWLKLDY